MSAAEAPATGGDRRARWILRRWPTAVALTAAFLIFGGVTAVDESTVQRLKELIPLLALEYLILAALGRRWASWPVVAALSAVITVAEFIEPVSAPAVFGVIALAMLIWAAIDGRLFRPGMFRVEALGMVAFGALAVVALMLDPDIGRFVVAAAWLAHGVWDFVHHRMDKVVLKSYAEACGVLDVLVAVGLLALW